MTERTFTPEINKHYLSSVRGINVGGNLGGGVVIFINEDRQTVAYASVCKSWGDFCKTCNKSGNCPAFVKKEPSDAEEVGPDIRTISFSEAGDADEYEETELGGSCYKGVVVAKRREIDSCYSASPEYCPNCPRNGECCGVRPNS